MTASTTPSKGPHLLTPALSSHLSLWAEPAHALHSCCWLRQWGRAQNPDQREVCRPQAPWSPSLGFDSPILDAVVALTPPLCLLRSEYSLYGLIAYQPKKHLGSYEPQPSWSPGLFPTLSIAVPCDSFMTIFSKKEIKEFQILHLTPLPPDYYFYF